MSVVPQVSVTWYDNTDADEDDEQAWSVRDLTWDAVSGTGVYAAEERIN